MNLGKLFILLFLFVLSYSSLTVGKEIEIIKIDGKECVKGELIIRFRQPFSKANTNQIVSAKTALLHNYNGRIKQKWNLVKAELWEINDGDLKTILDSFNQHPLVEYAEPNFILKEEGIPNDPDFDLEWGLHNTGQILGIEDADIDAPEAWDITTGDTSIVVGIIDTGIDYLHPDLKDNIWKNPNEIPDNDIDDDANGYVDDVYGWDFCNDDNDPMDDESHGTHVAGTIGAVGNNEAGIAGVAWNVKLMALKFLNDQGSGRVSDMISCLEYATNMGVKITSNSYGGFSFSQSEYDVISAADSAGALFIAAAGNEGQDADIYPHYPSCYDLDNIISVASSDYNDNLSSFSNRGISTVDIAAPGSFIYSTLPGIEYGYNWGTSMAAPHVAGVAVLTWSVFPDLNHLEIKRQILGSVDPLPGLTGTVRSGGRLNAYNSVYSDQKVPFTLEPVKQIFNACLINEHSNAQIVRIINVSDVAITIDSVTVDNGFLVKREGDYDTYLNIFQIETGQEESLDVVFSPDSVKYYERYLKIYYHTPDQNVKQKVVLLHGWGINTGTIIEEGAVAGNWIIDNSPYAINGDITLGENDELNIHPGVEVIFFGHFKFTVGENGALNAIGNTDNKITFTAKDTVRGWNGLRFLDSGNDDTLKYCIIKHSRKLHDYSPGNRAGGGLSSENTDIVIENCIVSNNEISGLGADGGGIGIIGGQVYIVGNLICNNSVNNTIIGDGGGLYISNTNALLINNTIVNNFCPDLGEGLYNRSGNLQIFNCIFWGNKSDDDSGEMVLQNIDNPAIINSIIENGKSFGEYISDDPKFINPLEGVGNKFNGLKGDWRLSSESPAINSAYSDTILAWLPKYDLDGHPRIMHSFADIGAYENDYEDIYITTFPFKNLDFGNISLSDSLEKTVRIYNSGDFNLEISNIMIQDDSLNVFELDQDYTDVTLLPGDSLLLDIIYRPFSVSLNKARLNISSNASNFPQKEISLYGKGFIGVAIEGALSGILQLDNSPFAVMNDIFIPAGEQLVIEPGVDILFCGHYGFTVGENARLIAKGSQTDSITFTAIDTSVGWNGIRFINSEFDDTLKYCKIIYGKKYSSGEIYDLIGAALYLEDSSPFISNCYFANNQISSNNYSGGAIFITGDRYNYFSHPKIVENIFKNNKAAPNGSASGGAIHIANWGGSLKVTIIGNIFHQNYARWGAVINVEECQLIFANNTVFNNSGGSIIYIGSRVMGYIRNNYISNNEAIEILTYGPESLYIQNNLIVNNLCGGHGSFLIGGDCPSLFITNNLIAYNSSTDEAGSAGLVFEYGANPALDNNIIWNNYGDEIKSDDLSDPQISYSLIDKGFEGIGNIDENPLFVNPPAGIGPEYDGLAADWHLQSNSPCIDTGNPDTTNLNLPQLDFDGNPRIWDGDEDQHARIDIGVYEYGSKPIEFINLNEGWNLISLNNSIYSDSVHNLFSNILSKIVTVIGYDVEQQIFTPFSQPESNTLKIINNLHGYWIKMQDSDHFYVSPEKIDPNISIPMKVGWNLISYLPDNSDSTQHALQSILDNVLMVKSYDEQGLTWIPTLADSFNTLNIMLPGYGYWIKLSQIDTLIYPGSHISSDSTNSLASINKIQSPTKDLTLTNEWINIFAHNIRIDDEPIAKGIKITARDPEGVLCGEYTTNHEGYLPLIPVYRDDFTTIDIDEGALPGDSITLYIDNFELKNKIVWTAMDQVVDISDEISTNLYNSLDNIPLTFDLQQNFPNPFNPSTTIKYQVPREEKVNITIYNILGEKVHRILNARKKPGYYEIKWNGSDEFNHKVASGLYFYRMKAGNFVKTNKMILIR